MKENILGYAVDRNNVDECSDAIMTTLAQGDRSCRWLACLNPHSYAVALDDRSFASALHDANWLVPDGVGLVWASAVLGGQVRVRVTGSDIFSALHHA